MSLTRVPLNVTYYTKMAYFISYYMKKRFFVCLFVFSQIEYLSMYFRLWVHIFVSEIYSQKHKFGSLMEQKIIIA